MRGDNYSGFWHSENGAVFMVCFAIVLLFLTLIGGIVTYHAFDRLYLDSYQLGVERVLDGDWVQYHVNTDGLACDFDMHAAEDGIDIYCRVPELVE